MGSTDGKGMAIVQNTLITHRLASPQRQSPPYLGKKVYGLQEVVVDDIEGCTILQTLQKVQITIAAAG